MSTKHQNKLSENFHNIPKSYIREILNVANQDGMISFAGGLPNPTFFPQEELAASAQEVLKTHGNEILQYAGSQGYLPLRKWIVNRYNSKYNMKISPENIVITNGSQQTIDVISKMFLNTGDSVIVEKPTYLGGIQAMSGYSPEFLGIDLHEDGPDLKQIENYCLNNIPKFMYGIPNFQNPSGICYSLEKRRQLASLLKKYNLLLLEDDPYNEIRFEGDQLLPVYSMAPENVFWSGSFSKMIAPGLRLGWIVLPEGLTSGFIKTKQSSDLHSNNLSQYTIHHYLSHHDIDNHLGKVRKGYKAQADYMKEMISKYFPNEIQSTNPEGGMFLWVTLPPEIDAYNLSTNCLNNNVAVVPGESFFTENTGTSHLRLNFSNSNNSQIEQGIKTIAKEFEKVLVKNISLSVSCWKQKSIK